MLHHSWPYVCEGYWVCHLYCRQCCTTNGHTSVRDMGYATYTYTTILLYYTILHCHNYSPPAIIGSSVQPVLICAHIGLAFCPNWPSYVFLCFKASCQTIPMAYCHVVNVPLYATTLAFLAWETYGPSKIRNADLAVHSPHSENLCSINWADAGRHFL